MQCDILYYDPSHYLLRCRPFTFTQGSESLGSSAQIFAGNLFGTGGGGYSTWLNFDGNGDQVNDDPARHDWNVDQWVDKFVQDAISQNNHTLSMHQM